MIPDDPISTKENDLLHRYPLAARIAGMLNNFKADQSIVIGIEGDWGSGKTSFINLLLEDLSSTNNLVIRFNPWNFSDQNELIKDFFNSIINSIKSCDGQHGEEKAKKIKQYSEKLLKHSDFLVAPEISLFGIFKLKLGKWSKHGSDEPLEKQKVSVNILLKKIGKRIVIVIDDIDRLDSNETKLIFKLVKITGNFSNTVFILAYDRKRVCERIKEDGVEGEEYLKKIVQVSFSLPIPDRKDLLKILTTDLDKTIQGIDEKYWDEVRWGNLFHGGFKEIFPNVRDIKRFVSSLSLDLEIVGKDEINPIDFIGIEAIRVVAPETYSIIRNEKDAFINTGKYYFGHDVAKEKEERKKIYEEAIVKSPEAIRNHIRGIIRQLFPPVDGIYTNTSYGGDWLQIWRKQLRVCAEDVFDKYFSLTVPSTCLSEKSIKDLLENLDAVDIIASKLRIFQDEDKLRLVLDRLLDHIGDLNDDQKEKLIIAVYDLAETANEGRRGLFDIEDIDSLTMRLGYHILKSINKDKRKLFISKTFESTKSVYSPIHLISLLNQEKEKYDKKQSLEEPLLSAEEISEFKKKSGERIAKSAEESSLVASKNFLYLMFRWREWGSEEAAKKYIAKMIENEEGLFAMLRGSISEYLSQSMNDFVPKRVKQIDRTLIGVFIDIGEIDKRIAQLDVSKLDEERANIIKLYKKPHKDHSND